MPPPPTLFDIPEVPFKRIVESLGPFGTVNFALSSKEVEEFIKTTNLYVEELSVEIYEKHCEIRLKFFYAGKELEWKFMQPTDNKKKAKKSNLMITECQEPLQEFKKAVKWLTELIRFPVTNVEIVGPDFPGTSDLLMWPLIHQCERLSIDLISEMNGNLDEFNDLENLNMIASTWIQPEHLKNLQVPNIRLFSMDWNAQDINQIIRDWKESSNRKLKILKINCKQIENTDEIMRELDIQPWNRDKRQKMFPRDEPLKALNCENALDIERDDGLLASILINDNGLNFVVWHSRFPDREQPNEN